MTMDIKIHWSDKNHVKTSNKNKQMCIKKSLTYFCKVTVGTYYTYKTHKRPTLSGTSLVGLHWGAWTIAPRPPPIFENLVNIGAFFKHF